MKKSSEKTHAVFFLSPVCRWTISWAADVHKCFSFSPLHVCIGVCYIKPVAETGVVLLLFGCFLPTEIALTCALDYKIGSISWRMNLIHQTLFMPFSASQFQFNFKCRIPICDSHLDVFDRALCTFKPFAVKCIREVDRLILLRKLWSWTQKKKKKRKEKIIQSIKPLSSDRFFFCFVAATDEIIKSARCIIIVGCCEMYIVHNSDCSIAASVIK